ncbi:MAG: glycosyltransferase family 2 protein [Pseudomonadota bacterium]
MVSVVVPVYDEAEVLERFHARLAAAMNAAGVDWEVVYVNDGSRDRSLDIMRALNAQDPHVAVLNLSRNFGKEIALTAGLDRAAGDAVVVIDADLQDPPELIPELLEVWATGVDVVYAQRKSRRGESWLKRQTAFAFYRVMRRLTKIDIPPDTGDFRLMSRRSVDALLQLREHHRFMKGLFAWVGFSTRAVPYLREARAGGSSKWNYWKLWNFALEGITGFSVLPLKVATYLGLGIALLSGLYAVYLVISTLIYGNPVPGYPSLLVTILFMGSTQLIVLGIIGEYLGRSFNELKQRPLYFVESYSPPESRTNEMSQALHEVSQVRHNVRAAG